MMSAAVESSQLHWGVPAAGIDLAARTVTAHGREDPDDALVCAHLAMASAPPPR